MFKTQIKLISAILLISTTHMMSESVVPSTSSALYLTPLIKQNRIQEARNMSTVSSELFNVTSYSGFFTVNEEFNSNIFYWYFPVANKSLDSTPWIIWLQGGPGATSMYGLFKEIGPFKYDDKLEIRNTSWWTRYSMVFIDNPVGTGFSFTTNDAGYPKDIQTYSAHLYSVVKQLTVVYPELGKAPLYLAGESYAGHYVPGLALKILESQRNAESIVHLQGLILGNPVIDRDDIVDITSAFYNWGLVDAQGALAAKSLQDEYYQAVQGGDALKAADLREILLDKLQTISDKEQTYNILKNYDDIASFKSFLDLADVRRMIHVGQIMIDGNNRMSYKHLRPDFLAHISPILEELLENYKVLLYCGQLDLTTPCVAGAEARRRKWRWSGRDQFLMAPRKPWYYNGTVAGYVKTGGRFTEVLMVGAGHLVPLDKPEQTLKLVSSFIDDVEIVHWSPLEVVPGYVEYGSGREQVEDNMTAVLITSVVINVVLVIALVISLVAFLKWKRQNLQRTPSSECMLTLD